MVADQLEMQESMPGKQAAWLFETLLAAWAPTTVDWYSKSLAEWQQFAKIWGLGAETAQQWG